MLIGQALDLVSRYDSLRNPLTSLGDYLAPMAPIVLYLFVFFNFIINKLNQTSSLFNFSFMRLFLSHNPAKRAALLAV